MPPDFVIGTSRWDGLEDRLTEIKGRHGFTPDHPLVRSVTAYLTERAEIEADPGPALVAPTEPPGPDPDGPIDQARAYRVMLFTFRMGNAQGLHFPRVNSTGADIRSAADLWADITFRLYPVRFLIGAGARERPLVCPQDLEAVYGVMRRLNLPGTPDPPYPSFTPAEAEHELQRIADRLEQSDRADYDRVLLQETPSAAVSAGAVPVLGDLIAYHRAWEDDPATGGSGLVYDPTPGSGGTPRPPVRVQPDRLTPVARALRDADIRYQVEDVASLCGFCAVGDFSPRAAETIKARLINVRSVGTTEADATPLTDLLDFLAETAERPGEAGPDVTEPERWVTVTKAAKAAGTAAWNITRAADQGHLKTNGKTRTERRIDKISLMDWLLVRAEQPDPEESDAQVHAAYKRSSRD